RVEELDLELSPLLARRERERERERERTPRDDAAADAE
ncbi:MAG: 30S ribosomal protein S6, partial [Alphaproteobacteria bacterium]